MWNSLSIGSLSPFVFYVMSIHQYWNRELDWKLVIAVRCKYAKIKSNTAKILNDCESQNKFGIVLVQKVFKQIKSKQSISLIVIDFADIEFGSNFVFAHWIFRKSCVKSDVILHRCFGQNYMTRVTRMWTPENRCLDVIRKNGIFRRTRAYCMRPLMWPSIWISLNVQ